MSDQNGDSTIAAVTKTIYLIRHAESEENHRMRCLFRVATSVASLSLPTSNDISTAAQLLYFPSQVDTNISDVGRRQIEHMAQKLAEEDFVRKQKIQLVIHSPLKRARQTSKGILQCLAENELEEEIKHTSVTRVIEMPLLIERTPMEWMPGKYDQFEQRIRQWEQYVLEQPEERIAVVGHSQFFKAMLNLPDKFRNCDLWEVKLRSDTSKLMPTNPDFPMLPPQWFGLRQLYDGSGEIAAD